MSDHHQRYSEHRRRHRQHLQEAMEAEQRASGCGDPAFADAVHAQARQEVEDYNRRMCNTCDDPACGGLRCKGSKTGQLTPPPAVAPPYPHAHAHTRHAHGSPGSTAVRLSDVPWVAHSYREAPASGNSTGI